MLLEGSAPSSSLSLSLSLCLLSLSLSSLFTRCSGSPRLSRVLEGSLLRFSSSSRPLRTRRWFVQVRALSFQPFPPANEERPRWTEGTRRLHFLLGPFFGPRAARGTFEKNARAHGTDGEREVARRERGRKRETERGRRPFLHLVTP